MSRPERETARLPQLSTLRVFEAAARHESFIRAAQELNVTQGAVSKQIKNLEADLREQLFHRRNRTVVLTQKGRWLAGRLSSIFAEIEDAILDFRRSEIAPPLVVSCEPTLCLKLLIPNIAELKRETGLDICLLAAGGRIDFRRHHVDLAVRRDDFQLAPGIHSRLLAEEAVGLVCSPRLRLDACVSALHTASRPDAWDRWKPEVPEVSGSTDVVYEHFYLALEAAAAGQGIAVASIHMLEADLASGRLAVVRPFRRDGTRYVGLSRRPFQEDPRKSRFLDRLAARMEVHLSDHLVD